MAGEPSGNGTTSLSPKTDTKVNDYKGLLLKYEPAVTEKPCTAEAFNKSFETGILSNAIHATGEIPVAISDEQVAISDYHRSATEQANLQALLCTAMDSWKAYTNLNYCVSSTLAQESVSVQKLVGELGKSMDTAGKEFAGIAEKNKKVCDAATEVKKAIASLSDCFKKVCTDSAKQKDFVDAFNKVNDGKTLTQMAENLVVQSEQGYMAVTQAASVFALNSVTGYAAVIDTVKPQAEKFKKETDSNIESADKKMTDLQKKYMEASAMLITKKAEIGRVTNLKVGLENVFCALDKTAPVDGAHQKVLDEALGTGKGNPPKQQSS